MVEQANTAERFSNMDVHLRKDPALTTLASFRDIHAEKTITVCGCGESLNELPEPERLLTIGVNDVGRRFHPNYLVVVNPRNQFQRDRFRYVETSQASYLFTQLDFGSIQPKVIRFRLGSYGGTDCSDPNVLHYTQNSPYVAICLAVHMGARRIGLIGVDFTENHFFGNTGIHVLSPQLRTIDEQYRRLNEALRARGVEVYNLSFNSRLTAFPKMPLGEFIALAKLLIKPSADGSTLKIASYATTPIAGVPAILARCINARTSHTARCVWAQEGYGNGVTFEGDIQWSQTPEAAEAVLAEADLVIVHNGKVDPRHRPLLAGKAFLTLAHNYMWNVDQNLVRQGFPGAVIGQYQATLTEFKDWATVPNPIPFWEPGFQVGTKESVITICYTPSGKHERYALGHRLYWHGKGYATTMAVLQQLAARLPIRLEIIRDRQVSHAEALTMKRRAHIVIDECVTGSYHRNSLEGLAAGCVVINGLGLLPAVIDRFRYCTDESSMIPFVSTGLDNLETTLEALILKGAETLSAEGARNRQWLEQHWDFAPQWQKFWSPLVARAMLRAEPGHARTHVAGPWVTTTGANTAMGSIKMRKSKEGVSVIVPHGGRERLSHLAVSLANIRQCEGVSEVIVVDMSEAPFAQALARRWGAKYVFVYHQDVFERARAMNIGSALAEYESLLWKDNDLLIPTGFVAKAVAESRTRQLDYLIPYTCIKYLSASHSRDVMTGTLNPADCKPDKVLYSGRDISGGLGLVRTAFFLRYGGMHEGFRGWGGEDNAWSYKVSLIGRMAITNYRDQHLYHLFHPGSGAYGGGPHAASNPYYARNVELLAEIRAIKDQKRFLERFPPPSGFTCPWDKNKRVVFITEAIDRELNCTADLIARALSDLYGLKVDRIQGLKGDNTLQARILASTYDAIVTFGKVVGLDLLANCEYAPLWSRVLVVLSEATDFTATEIQQLDRATAILSFSASVRHVLKQVGLQPWTWIYTESEEFNATYAALAIVQPLSAILGDGHRFEEQGDKPIAFPTDQDTQKALPVWMYWEGECPEWIKACQQTIVVHARDVRLLTPKEFDRLWDVDRDIDLTRLHAAHRADFIRAFLLARYGGLWIDSDCIVMQSLQPILNALSTYDFLAHRDRQGYFPNGFIGATPGSVIAAVLYRRLCDILRSRQPLGWISLGGQPLTEVLKASKVPWYEIECERIQPICWSDPGAFFSVKEPQEHDRMFNDQAICYMLSNNAVQKYQAAYPSRNLLDAGTFFRYLLKRTLSSGESNIVPSTVSPTRLNLEHIPWCVEALADVMPGRVLEVGVGFGRWAMLVREFCEAREDWNNREKWRVQIEGIQSGAELVGEHHRILYNRIDTSDGSRLIDRMNDSWNMIIFGDGLYRWSREMSEKILGRALEISDYVLLNTSIRSDRRGNDNIDHGHNGPQALWTLVDFLVLSPLRYTVFNGSRGELVGAFLYSRKDPRHLKRSRPIGNIFEKVFRENLKLGDESVSGPGSCLAQTAEIRQRVPIVFEDMCVRSLLDAPCGDFHWMQHVNLSVDEYIGADVVQELIANNQKNFGSQIRRFINIDLMTDALPKVDLILCRDCLVHFSYEDIFLALKNFKRSRSRYLLTTTFTRLSTNIEVATGDWRPLNFQLSPFSFPTPVKVINEKCTEMNGRYSDKSLGLWRLEDLYL